MLREVSASMSKTLYQSLITVNSQFMVSMTNASGDAT